MVSQMSVENQGSACPGSLYRVQTSREERRTSIHTICCSSDKAGKE